MLLPIERKVFIQVLQFANGMDQKQWNIESRGNISEPFVENAGKSQKVITMVFQHATNACDAVGTKRLEASESFDDEIVELLND